jgi:L-methionine (R)-S-oxide reductase
MDFGLLEEQVRALIGDESDALANAANFAALVYQEITDLSWAGFYYARPSGELTLGPFQGKPACTRLPAGGGVCGRALAMGKTIAVDDVAADGEHIVCDPAARSELVVPLFWEGAAYGVFDLDSAAPARFSPQDSEGIERLVRVFTGLVPPPLRR